ncbi:MAG: phytoene/squalene synthase family protein [Betaproteobacteria bacterium]|nr:phytoene/squalene synthase family protein [Betaproteobacteria bacterium]NCA16190.1 phytoene/squalene synthase family protein [Betaproteobacteria bacterium]
MRGDSLHSACEALMQQGSKSFFAASRLLPDALKAPAAGLYAFCRVADDEVDCRGATPEVMAGLRTRLDRIYEGQPGEALADRAFAEVVHAYRLPKTLPLALLEGFSWDSDGRRYETLESLEDYGARVAGTVGAMMALILGVREPWALARACELGVAMQLTNIARDVGEDARIGRLYLPEGWMRQEGIDPELWLISPRFTPALGRVVSRLLTAADALYVRAEQGIAGLPRPCRPAITSARFIYSDIGRALARQDFNSFDRRAVVSPQRKVFRVVQSLASYLVSPAWMRGRTPLPAIAFLVDAARTPALARRPRTVDEKAGRMIDLLISVRSAKSRHSEGQHQSNDIRAQAS